MKLVSNWRKLWKSTTVVLAIILVALSAAQVALPTAQAVMDPATYAKVSAAMGILIAVLRYVQQEALKEVSAEEPKEQA